MRVSVAEFCSVANTCPLSASCKIAETCAELEEFAAELVSESIVMRRGAERCQELIAFKRRAGFRLISSTVKNENGLPVVPMGSENAFLVALKQYQDEFAEFHPA